MVVQLTAHLLLAREVKNHLNYEHRVFNSEEFLKTRAAGDQQFYKQVSGQGSGGTTRFLLFVETFLEGGFWGSRNVLSIEFAFSESLFLSGFLSLAASFLN